MIQVRQSMFETNSSSTHTLVIMNKSDFRQWTDSDDDDPENIIYIENHKDGLKLHTGKEVIEKLNENDYWSKRWAEDNYETYIMHRFAYYNLGWYSYAICDTREEDIDDDRVAVSIYISD